ncbi:MAG: YdaS family helix-turn-helix protein [Pseudomonadota bacterium]
MTKAITPFEALDLLLEQAKTQSALARALGVTQPSVWKWFQTSKRLPAEHVLKAESLFGVSRHDLRPDIYPRDYPTSDECLLAAQNDDDSESDGAHCLSETAK